MAERGLFEYDDNGNPYGAQPAYPSHLEPWPDHERTPYDAAHAIADQAFKKFNRPDKTAPTQTGTNN